MSIVLQQQTDRNAIQCMLDEVPYTAKPRGGEIPQISERLGGLYTAIPIDAFAIKVGERGHSFVPSRVDGGRKGENWQGASLFALDFDGQLGYDNFLARCRSVNMLPYFTYATFSSTNREKFRAVFLCSHFITDWPLWELVAELLQKLFPEADKQCFDRVRIFFGGNRMLDQFETSFAPHELLFNVKHYLIKADSKNANRNFQRMIEKKTRLNLDADNLGVSFSYDLEDVEMVFQKYDVEGTGKSSIIYKGNFLLPSTLKHQFPEIYTIFHWKNPSGHSPYLDKELMNDRKTLPKHDGAIRKTDKKKNLTDTEIEFLETSCTLLRDFLSGARHVTHNERFLLASNLNFWQRGKEVYTRGLAARNDYNHKENIWQSVANYGYHPMGCARCPYAEQCDHPTTITQLLKRKRNHVSRTGKWQSRISLTQAQEQLREALQQQCAQPAGNVSLIRAQTGIGKTRLVLEEDLTGFCIAFPTHELTQEAYHRYTATQQEKSKQAVLWRERPELPRDLSERVYKNDCIARPSLPIFQEALSHPEVEADQAWRQEIIDYISAQHELSTASTVFCTHERALYLNNPNIKTIVFDEDVLHCAIRVNTWKLSQLTNLLSELGGESDDLSLNSAIAALQAIASAEDNILQPGPKLRLTSPQWKSILDKLKTNSNAPILSLLTADYYLKFVDQFTGEPNIGAVTSRLPNLAYNTVILSATAEPYIYQRLFSEQCRILDIPRVTTAGRIIVHPQKSYSKTSINKELKTFVSTMKEEQQKYEFDSIITHKYMRDKLSREDGVPEIGGHFHAIAGVDKLCGAKIGVFGTPFRKPTDVLLIAKALGISCSVNDIEPARRSIQQGEFHFSAYFCSANPQLQRVEVGLIQAELIQACGRARTLHHSIDVHLYSQVPIPGAVLDKELGDNTGQGKSIRDTYSEARKRAHDIVAMTTRPVGRLSNHWIYSAMRG